LAKGGWEGFDLQSLYNCGLIYEPGPKV